MCMRQHIAIDDMRFMISDSDYAKAFPIFKLSIKLFYCECEGIGLFLLPTWWMWYLPCNVLPVRIYIYFVR